MWSDLWVFLNGLGVIVGSVVWLVVLVKMCVEVSSGVEVVRILRVLW